MGLKGFRKSEKSVTQKYSMYMIFTSTLALILNFFQRVSFQVKDQSCRKHSDH